MDIFALVHHNRRGLSRNRLKVSTVIGEFFSQTKRWQYIPLLHLPTDRSKKSAESHEERNARLPTLRPLP